MGPNLIMQARSDFSDAVSASARLLPLMMAMMLMMHAYTFDLKCVCVRAFFRFLSVSTCNGIFNFSLEIGGKIALNLRKTR